MVLYMLDILDEWLRSAGLLRAFMVFDQLQFRVFAAGATAFAIVILLGPRAISWLRSKKIGDQARFDVAQLDDALRFKANTPTMGGMLIGSAIVAATLLFADLGFSDDQGQGFAGRYVRYALIIALWLGILGGFDDWLKLTRAARERANPEAAASRQGLVAWEKLLFQLGIGALIGFFAWRAGMDPSGDSLAHVLNLPLQKTYDTPTAPDPAAGLIFLPAIVYVAIMMLFMSGMSNAVNITDGMDGLASGITAAIALGLVVLCFIAGDEQTARQLLVPYVATSGELAVVAASLAGACLGFLWFNCSPASVFMGDTGSLLLGGLIGYIAVVIRQEIVVLIMAGVVVLEIASVTMQVGWFKYTRTRFGEGRRIFRCAPYHWHLKLGGWEEQKVVARLWIVTAVLIAVGLATLKLR